MTFEFLITDASAWLRHAVEGEDISAVEENSTDGMHDAEYYEGRKR